MGSEVVVVGSDVQALPAVRQERAGMLAMATMSDGEFEVRLEALKKGQARIKRIKETLMEEGAHYGTIPGTQKPTLLKPGAEVLCSIYGLRPDFVPTIERGDGQSAPHIRVTMRCELHLGDIAGPVVAVGYGSANSWERKHRYRRGERTCPACGVVGHVIKGKEEYGGGWVCLRSKGGCGAKWPDGAAEIENQQAGDVENPDPFDLENTLVKMSKKRAFIDAALTGTASSDLFTQDMEETISGKDERPSDKQSKPGGGNGGTQATKPTCPKCNTAASVMPSQYVDNRLGCKPWYCKKCKSKWGNCEAPIDPDSEPWRPEEEEETR